MYLPPLLILFFNTLLKHLIMRNSITVKTQTESHAIIEFLSRYSPAKALRFLDTGLYADSELLELCTLKGKGRPARLRSSNKIEAALVPQKCAILHECFSELLEALMTRVVYESRAPSRPLFLRIRKNLEIRSWVYNNEVESALSRLPCSLVDLSDQDIASLINCLPRLKAARKFSSQSAYAQMLIGHYAHIIRKIELFSPTLTINAQKLQNVYKSKFFNVFFINSAFVLILVNFVAPNVLASYYLLLLHFLDFSAQSYSFTREVNAIKIDRVNNEFMLSEPDSFLLTTEAMTSFCDDFASFISSAPERLVQRVALTLGQLNVRNFEIELRLVDLLRNFAQLFMKFEKFCDRI